jgi:hypothetical protein
MSIVLERDVRRRRLVARVTGELTFSDAVTFLRTARAAPDVDTWPLLFDTCGATTSITTEDVERFVAEVDEIRKRSPISRGHVAIVADDDALYDRFLLYETRMSEIGVRIIRVFRQRPDAEHWLEILSAARHFQTGF